MSNAIQMRIKEAVAMEVEPVSGMSMLRLLQGDSQRLIFDTQCLGKAGHVDNEWQKVRLMPALLRIFTRVNLLVMVGEDQGMKCS